MPIEMIESFDMGTQIKVIGVGGGGGNAVEHMIEQRAPGDAHQRLGHVVGQRTHPDAEAGGQHHRFVGTNGHVGASRAGRRPGRWGPRLGSHSGCIRIKVYHAPPGGLSRGGLLGNRPR